jgi:2-polyprenyl-6-hydroxyphenyl methylase/3-demethylubiquinone-9 3-methyltransferase
MTRNLQAYEWQSNEPTCAAGYDLAAVVPLLNQRAVGGRRVLDVGCGNGFAAGKLAAQGFSVIGIDPSPTGVAVARRSYPNVRFEVMEPHENMLADLGEEPFDAVVSTQVIEHVFDAKGFASSCFHALRTGGSFVCSTPYHGYLKNIALAIFDKFDSHWNPLQAGGHIKFWSKRTLGQLLRETGFVNVRFSGAWRMPFLWKSLIAVAERPSVTENTLPAEG